MAILNQKWRRINNDALVKSRKYGWQSKKFKPSLNRGRANRKECKKCSGGLQAATMMWKAKAFRYNNREIPKNAAQQNRPPCGNWAFYEAIIIWCGGKENEFTKTDKQRRF